MKTFKFLSIALVCSLAAISCNKDKKPVPETTQINRVAAAAQHFVDAIDTASLAERVRQTLIIAQDFYSLEDNEKTLEPFITDIDRIIEEMVQNDTTTVAEATETTRKLLKIECTEILDLTRFAAKYVLTQKGYTKEECNHIIVELTGKDGVTSKLEINFSGKNNSLLVNHIDDLYWEYDDERNQRDIEYHSTTHFVLPGKLEVTLTHGKTKIASLTISDSLETDTLEDPSLLTEKNSLSVKLTVGMYTASLSATTGDKKIKASASLKSGKTTMIGVSASVDGIVIEEEGEEGYVFKDDVVGKASVSLDLMGEVQLKGTTPSVAELIKAAEFDDVRTMEQIVEDTNNNFSAGVYYNYGDHKHASIKAAVVKEEADWDVNGDWVVDEQDIEEYATLVVYFENNTAFSTLEKIFATEQFNDIFNKGMEKIEYLAYVLNGGEYDEED